MDKNNETSEIWLNAIKLEDPTYNYRMLQLKKWLDKCLNMKFKDIQKYGFDSMVQLFYNGYIQNATEIHTLQEFESEDIE